jgi:hypothetical protein
MAIVERYAEENMEHDEVRARKKFRVRTRILFFSGVAGWALWSLILFFGYSEDSDYWSAIGSLALFIWLVGIYVGAPLMIRSQYSAQEPTGWRTPAIVALAIPALLALSGLILTPTNFITTTFIFLFPLSIYMAIWTIVLRSKQKREDQDNGQIDH